MLSLSTRLNNAATLDLLSFLANREGLDNVKAHAFHPAPGFISPDDEQIAWSGRDWELIKPTFRTFNCHKMLQPKKKRTLVLLTRQPKCKYLNCRH